MSISAKAGFRQRNLQQKPQPQQNKTDNASIEHSVNTCMFFLYVSYQQAQKLNIAIYEHTNIVQRNTDIRIKNILNCSNQCLAHLHSAYNNFLCYVQTYEEHVRIESILSSAHRHIYPTLLSQQNNIFDNYKGKFLFDFNDDFSYIASYVTHVRRMLIATMQFIGDMTSKFGNIYPALQDVVGVKDCAFAYQYINECYSIAMNGVNIDLTKDSRSKSIQRFIIQTMADKSFYSKCCHMANVHS